MTTSVVPFRFVPEWTFGERVRKIRREAGLSQVEFAARLGVGDRAVASWESGRSKPGDIVEVAKVIRREFGVPTSWTLGTDEPTVPEGDGGLPLPRSYSKRQPAGYSGSWGLVSVSTAANDLSQVALAA